MEEGAGTTEGSVVDEDASAKQHDNNLSDPSVLSDQPENAGEQKLMPLNERSGQVGSPESEVLSEEVLACTSSSNLTPEDGERGNKDQGGIATAGNMTQQCGDVGSNSYSSEVKRKASISEVGDDDLVTMPAKQTRKTKEKQHTTVDHTQNISSKDIVRGLVMSTGKYDDNVKVFNYLPLFGTEKDLPVEKLVLSTPSNVAVGPNIFCHELQRHDNLAQLFEKYEKEKSKAVVLINYSNDFFLDPSLMPETQPSIPVILTCKVEGERILDYYDNSDDFVYAEIHKHKTRSSSGSGGRTQVKKRQKGETNVDSTSTSNVELSARTYGKSHPQHVLQLKETIEKCMFTGSKEPLVLIQSPGNFAMVMSAFHNYEKMAKDAKNYADLKVIIQLLRMHMDRLNWVDMAFYIVIIYRVCTKKDAYNEKDVHIFINDCIKKLEEANVGGLVMQMNTFIEKGTFEVIYSYDGVEEQNVIISQLLQNACMELSSICNKQHASSNSRTSDIIYSCLLWVSMALKLREACGFRATKNIWTEKFVNVCRKCIDFEETTMKALKNGLEVSKHLKLSSEFDYSYQHLTDLLVKDGEKELRRFLELKIFFETTSSFLQSSDDLLGALKQLHKVYNGILRDSRESKKLFISQPKAVEKAMEISWAITSLTLSESNLEECIKEGIYFLDTVLDMLFSKNAAKEKIHSTVMKWMELLLSFVDITKEECTVHLKLFVNRKNKVTKAFNENIKDTIRKKIHDSLSILTMRQFLKIYSIMKGLPRKTIGRFLMKYVIPLAIDLCEEGWKNLFEGVINDHSTVDDFRCFIKFIMKCSQKYALRVDSHKFIGDLLNMGLQISTPETQEIWLSVRDEFSGELRDFVRANKKDIMRGMRIILDKAVTEDELSTACMDVLSEEILPQVTIYQKEKVEEWTIDFFSVIQNTIKYYIKRLSLWPIRLQFCWEILANTCSKIKVDTGLMWFSNYKLVILELDLASTFRNYCSSSKHPTDSLKIPDEIKSHPSKHLQTYFKWILMVQQALKLWNSKFNSKNVTLDDIVQYELLQENILVLGNRFSYKILVTPQLVKTVKAEYIENLRQLDAVLLKHCDAKCCTLPSILNSYGVALAQDVQKFISNKVCFPGQHEKQEVKVSSYLKDLSSRRLSIQVDKSVTLYKLSDIIMELNDMQGCLNEYLEMLVFFKVHKSSMFDKYVQYNLQKVIKLQESSVEASDDALSFLSVPTFVKPSLEPDSTNSGNLNYLNEALCEVRKLLDNIISGNAVYSDIVAEDDGMLHDLDINHEFSILKKYSELFNNGTTLDGLDGMYSILELFQYTKHIYNIRNVCEQYRALRKCHNDEKLKELVRIVETHDKPEDRSKLTPLEARKKMERVKKLLYIEKNTDSKCLDVFGAISNSVDFYKFIEEKQFHTEAGHRIFLQQYQLITAQLQHEQYDEEVLNHLLVALKIIKIFMNSQKSFTELMQDVTALKSTDGFLQLDTVNRNITTIRLWFSRAEGDTLENVATELRCMMKSGKFVFKLPKETLNHTGACKWQLCLEYIPLSASSKNDKADAGVQQQLECKTSDQIDDFVRKLGFIDKSTEQGISEFLYLSQIVYKLLDLYQKLKELGHPDYLNESVPPISCCESRIKVDERVQTTKQFLQEWIDRISELQNQYHWLLYFSIQKMLYLYFILHHPHKMTKGEKVDCILREVAFLTENTPFKRQTLAEKIEGALDNLLLPEPADPMLVVGDFLNILLHEHVIQHLCFAEASMINSQDANAHKTQFLFSCSLFSQSNLISFILDHFNSIPAAFQIMHCNESTTKEDLDLFLRRTEIQPSKYMMLYVDLLPLKLQEDLMRYHLSKSRNEVESGERRNVEVNSISTIIFVETSPSLLREMPWISLKEIVNPREISKQDRQLCDMATRDLATIELVYGAAGDGKTHYIKEKLSESSLCKTIAINEGFTPYKIISKLRSIPFNSTNVGIFFNFTILPPSTSTNNNESENESEKELEKYKALTDKISWFFFNLFIFDYVEDHDTGLSFRIPGGLDWNIFVEVPSRSNGMSPDSCLKDFKCDIPVFDLVGSSHFVSPDVCFATDDDVQLVCKYLQAYTIRGCEYMGIDREYSDGNPPIKFSQEDNLDEEDCQHLLNQFMPSHVSRTKTTQQLFVRYMKRRCEFLDNCPGFNYNQGIGEKKGTETTDSRLLGSTLMSTMLQEVSTFCDPAIMDNWHHKAHQQLIYDFKDGNWTFGLISVCPSKIEEDDRMKYESLGIQVPLQMETYTREVLDNLLSRALNVELEDKSLRIVDISNYVLTLDYAIKMLNIHERHECGIPVIIKGETGVGKTALVEMLSKLWNESLLTEWMKQKRKILEIFHSRMSKTEKDLVNSEYMNCLKAMEEINKGNVKRDDIQLLCGYLKGGDGCLFSEILDSIETIMKDPIVPLLESTVDYPSLTKLLDKARQDSNPECMADLLFAIINSRVKSSFYKIKVHAAMTPETVINELTPIIELAEKVRKTYCNNSLECSKSNSARMPYVTAFLDEVNTSSCLGIFKEIIVDRTMDGKPIPDNVFIVAACNPYRGNSLMSHDDTWLDSSYYVHPLHPTLELLMWDYGSLDEYQERDYVYEKMRMIRKDIHEDENQMLANLIVKSQKLMREFALKQLQEEQNKERKRGISDLKLASRSCVSQRDIQRVLTFYRWFIHFYEKKRRNSINQMHRRAMLVALGIVYYMRLNRQFREEYRKFLDKRKSVKHVSFTTAFNDELDYFIDKVELPKGIARTQALKENLFATIVCTVTHTPLIIVGAPGSSKTLSFNQTIANLKGQESKQRLFRDTEVFKSLDPHYYQCSRRTTSNEIETVFSRAVNRQYSHQSFNFSIYCVVFMDEAGLPQNSHESLKVLHYHLDNQVVSFVAITNQILDAAKTNRAVSLYRPEASDEDLDTLAQGCFCSDLKSPPPEMSRFLETVVKLCKPYSDLMHEKHFSDFFGLRDFIHFINYLRRKRDENDDITPQLVMHSLERNFNGTEHFNDICMKFLQAIGSDIQDVTKRGIVNILQDSLCDRPIESQGLAENEVRYKLIIDPSKDDSLIRSTFSMGLLKRAEARMFLCSDFSGDGELQKINTIAAIRHSAIEGHTVIMSQTDDIHESFYDLFNQRFRRIDDPNRKSRYYTNIAIGAHLKPSRVNPNFQCIVVIKKDEVENTPPPFLNRFEKYFISYSSLLDMSLKSLPQVMADMVNAAKNKVKSFIAQVCGSECLYGWQESETLDSLVLFILPPLNHDYGIKNTGVSVYTFQNSSSYLFQEILRFLCENSGFNIFEMNAETDGDHIIRLIRCDSQLKQPITQDEIVHSVTEAFNYMYSSQKEESKYDLTPQSIFVVAVVQQILICCLMKHVLQLMTAEAIVLKKKQIPSVYLKYYLHHQAHFSLKDVLTDYHTRIGSNENSCKTPNKLILFSCSSSLIRTLPSQFPCTVEGNVSGDQSEITSIVRDLIFHDCDKLMLHNLSTLYSQSSVQEILEKFVNSNAEVLVLLTNVQATTTKTINHIRVMIEEAEIQGCTKQKLFVMLLHFPPAMLLDHCYPALFLKGWNHLYLDTISHSYTKGIVSVQEWFQRSCTPQCFDANSAESTTYHAALQLCGQLIPAIQAHMHFGNNKGNSFNSLMDETQRQESLRELLQKYRLDEALSIQFSKYWKHKTMLTYLERAAIFSRQKESTLSITDYIQTEFKKLFLAFCVHMLTRANENYNLDIVFEEAYSSLFLDIFKCFPTPPLNQLNILITNVLPLQSVIHQPSFPFFSHICGLVERNVEKGLEEANLKMNILEDLHENDWTSSSKKTDEDVPTFRLQVLVQSVMEKVKQMSDHQSVIGVVTSYMSRNDIWNRYFEDFISFKLDMKIPAMSDGNPSKWDIIHHLLQAYFQDLLKGSLKEKLVHLHCYVSTCQRQLVCIADLLRPLCAVQKLNLGLHSVSPTSPNSSLPEKKLLSAVRHNRGHTFMTHLAFVVITILFDALSVISQANAIEDEKVKNWFVTYRELMHLPVLKKYRLSPRKALEASEWGRLEYMQDIMQATYLTIIIFPSLNHDAFLHGIQVFLALQRKYPQESNKVHRPGLSGVIEAIFGVIFPKTDYITCLQQCNKIAWGITESVLSHFFSPYFIEYNNEDVLWFFKLLNINWKLKVFPPVLIQGSVGIMDSQSENASEVDVQGFTRPIEVAKCKFYLARILSGYKSNDNQEENVSDELLFYSKDMRELVGKTICPPDNEFEPKTSYVPLFYQNSLAIKPGINGKNPTLQQPLCHLYFITVFEHLQSRCLQGDYDLPSLVNAARSIEEKFDTLTKWEAALLQLEFQAVTQVLIQHFVEYLDPNNPQKLGEIQQIKIHIERLLNDAILGGGAAMGHAMTLSLHLFKFLKSSRRFEELLGNANGNLQSFDCLKPIQAEFKKTSGIQPHLFPFLQQGANTKLTGLYKSIKTVMFNIHNKSGTSKELLALAQKWCSENEDEKDNYLSFRMIVWLVTYYEFYDKQVVSETLSEVLGKSQFLQYFKDNRCVIILQCFLNPELMMEQKEPPNPRFGEQVYKVGPTGSVQTLRRGGQLTDPIHQFFKPENPKAIDQSDIDLRHALANMVAVVFGCHSHFNHLWYHLFEPHQLENTYITGFMYDGVVKHSGRLYDCGVELTAEGLYGRDDYKQHACRGTLSLHSLYLLLWANFGAFCLCLLTQRDAQVQLHGTILSDWLSIRHYCISQLKGMWMHMGNNLSMSEEKRAFFVSQAMYKLYQVLLESNTATSPAISESSSEHCIQLGLFNSREQLDIYEEMWHKNVFQPTLEELPEKFQELQKSTFFTNMSNLDDNYPHFPSKEEFLHTIISAGDIKQNSMGSEFSSLMRIVMDSSRLRVGGLLLPDIVEFYQWLHTHLSHLITSERASSLTIGRVINLAKEKYARKYANYLSDLYERVKKRYNSYVMKIGGVIGVGACATVHQGNEIVPIRDDFPLLHFLSDDEEEGQGNDWLYIVINELVATHNQIIENVYFSLRKSHLAPLLPDEPFSINITEVKLDTAIVAKMPKKHGISHFLQLARSCYHPYSTTPSSAMDRFSFKQLMEDLVKYFVAGKPIIKTDNFRTVFKFKKEKTATLAPSTVYGIVACTSDELQDIREKLTDSFRVIISDDLLRKFEYDFHSASHTLLNEVVIALRTIIGHLIKALANQETDLTAMQNQSVAEFLLSLFKDKEDYRAILCDMGLQNAQPSHFSCLADLHLSSTYNCLEIFVEWVIERRYDFCLLPFPLKVHLNPHDQQSICNIWKVWKGSTSDLKDDIQQLSEVLKHSEQDIIRRVKEIINIPIRRYLTELHMLSEKDPITEHLSNTITLQNYVAFRLALRKVLQKINEELEQEEEGEETGDRWIEVETYPYKRFLPHFREKSLFNLHSDNNSEVEEDDQEVNEDANFISALQEDPIADNEPGEKSDHDQEQSSSSDEIDQEKMGEQNKKQPKEMPDTPVAKRRKMNKDKLAKWLDAQGVDENDIEIIKSKGVNEMAFMKMKRGDKYTTDLSEVTVDNLPELQDALRNETSENF